MRYSATEKAMVRNFINGDFYGAYFKAESEVEDINIVKIEKKEKKGKYYYRVEATNQAGVIMPVKEYKTLKNAVRIAIIKIYPQPERAKKIKQIDKP